MDDLKYFMCRYLSMPWYNADFWNGTVFRGKRRVRKWQLERWKSGKGKRERNEVWMRCKGKKNVLLAVKVVNVLDVDELAEMRDDDLRELERQALWLQWRRRKQDEYTTSNRESYYFQDRVIPIHRIVLYCGEKDNSELSELVNMDGMVLERQNYWMRVFSLKALQEENFETNLREIIAIFKRKDSLGAVEDFYSKNRDKFREMDKLSIDLLGALLEIRWLRRYTQKGGGGVDLCKALDDARREGWRKGVEKGRQEGTFSTLCCLVEKEVLMLEEAAREAGMSEEAFSESMQFFLNTASTISQ